MCGVRTCLMEAHLCSAASTCLEGDCCQLLILISAMLARYYVLAGFMVKVLNGDVHDEDVEFEGDGLAILSQAQLAFSIGTRGIIAFGICVSQVSLPLPVPALPCPPPSRSPTSAFLHSKMQNLRLCKALDPVHHSCLLADIRKGRVCFCSGVA